MLPAAACPVCDTEPGAAVRQGIFGANFAADLLRTLAPAPVLLGSLALVSHLLGKDQHGNKL